ncbi:MAG: isocyanide synthase family protein [bacterium]|nr:isocyanide synthase family protein [bacterium]
MQPALSMNLRGPLRGKPGAFSVSGRGALDREPLGTYRTARAILGELMQARHLASAEPACAGASCPACQAPHRAKLVAAIRRQEPLVFVLPAFPGKSPNPAKVLGPLPDLGERLALQSLHDLAERIGRFHAPGARIVLCSDGRVFSDVVGMHEGDVSAYQRELESEIAAMGLDTLSVFSLDDLADAGDFSRARDQLMERHGLSLEVLRERVRRGGAGSRDLDDREAHRLYCGITRFMFEDSLHPGQTRSRTALQKEARVRAYEVIRRSQAWGDLLAETFPEAIRLSIHPQACGATKLGVRLLPGELWMTPWHGVAVRSRHGIVLMKRAEAERLGALCVTDARGRADHFVLPHPVGFQGGASR